MTKRKRTKGQTTLYNITHKSKDRVTRISLNTGGGLGCSGRRDGLFSIGFIYLLIQCLVL